MQKLDPGANTSRWDDIRFFLAVARQGSVAGAARELKVNYTTVARRIEAMQETLQVQLFERHPEGYKLTAEAESVLEEALAMAESAAAFDRSLFGQNQKLVGNLRVSSSDAIACSLLIPHLGRFRALHPGINLELVTSDAPVNLNYREADIALRVGPSPPENLIGRRIAELSYGIYASKRYAASYRRLNTAQVHSICWLEDPSPGWREEEFDKTTSGLRFNSTTAMCTAIASGLGIGPLPDCVAACHPEQLIRVNRQPVESGWFLWILQHPDTRKTARLRAFHEFLSALLEEQTARIALLV